MYLLQREYNALVVWTCGYTLQQDLIAHKAALLQELGLESRGDPLERQAGHIYDFLPQIGRASSPEPCAAVSFSQSYLHSLGSPFIGSVDLKEHIQTDSASANIFCEPSDFYQDSPIHFLGSSSVSALACDHDARTAG